MVKWTDVFSATVRPGDGEPEYTVTDPRPPMVGYDEIYNYGGSAQIFRYASSAAASGGGDCEISPPIQFPANDACEGFSAIGVSSGLINSSYPRDAYKLFAMGKAFTDCPYYFLGGTPAFDLYGSFGVNVQLKGTDHRMFCEAQLYGPGIISCTVNAYTTAAGTGVCEPNIVALDSEGQPRIVDVTKKEQLSLPYTYRKPFTGYGSPPAVPFPEGAPQGSFWVRSMVNGSGTTVFEFVSPETFQAEIEATASYAYAVREKIIAE